MIPGNNLLTCREPACSQEWYMRDSDVRHAVKAWLRAEYAHDPDSYLVEEMGVWSGTYGRVFDYLHLVVGKRHAEDAEKLLPTWWGIRIAVAEGQQIKLLPHRPPSLNPSPDPYLIAELLTKEEALGVLNKIGLTGGWRSKPVRFIHKWLAAELPLNDLKDQVRAVLKQRPRSLMVSLSAPVLCAD
jgi:hypothetical protein